MSLEMIGILGALLGFLVYGMVRTQLARREAAVERKAEKDSAAAAERVR